MRYSISRRRFLAAGSAGLLLGLPAVSRAYETDLTSEERIMADKGKLIDLELVQRFVGASHANIELVKQCVEAEPSLVKASWDWGGGDWETGLEAASHMGNIEIMRYLLERGAAQHVYCAAALGQRELVGAYVAANPEVARSRGVHGISLFYHAASSGDTQLADLLFVHCGSEFIDESLHAAVRFGHTDMVAWLLSRGIGNAELLNFAEQTPLQVAEEKGYGEIAELLRGHGVGG
ncbi:MAG: hypothetical protein GKR89_27470 [Candidatus Latescibacteria bacterium]|nr:hypothetical protein [Candidatus Latescibacterota bacterium]